MQLKRNTKEFKKVKELVEAILDDSERNKNLQLFLTKAGDPLSKRIKLNAKLKDSEILSGFQVDALKYAFLDKSFQLFRDEDEKGLYYFKTRNDPDWDQHPFQLKGSASEELQQFWK